MDSTLDHTLVIIVFYRGSHRANAGVLRARNRFDSKISSTAALPNTRNDNIAHWKIDSAVAFCVDSRRGEKYIGTHSRAQ